MDAINMSSVAWVMTSTALVMIMLPGLSLFYSGLVRGKNALATAMHSFTCLGIVLVVWVLWGYSLASVPALAASSAIWTTSSSTASDWSHGPDRRSGTAIYALSGYVRRDHAGAAGGRHRRTGKVSRLWSLRRALGHLRLLPNRALGLGRWLATWHRRERLCRRLRCAHVLRRGGAGGRTHPGPAPS